MQKEVDERAALVLLLTIGRALTKLRCIVSEKERQKITDLTELVKGGKHLPKWFVLWAEKRLGLHALNVAHNHIEEDWEAGSSDNFFKLACKYLSLNYELEGLENIPKEGPCVIVSNHAHGMSDGIIFGDIAMKVRDDVRIVVNEFLHHVRGMRPYQITVDVYGGEAAKRANMQGMREMLRWLKDGHCLLVFPSGSAATWSWKDGRVIDDPWQTNISSIIRKTGATVVPMHFSGHNGFFFQTISVLAKGLRSNFLAREILRDGKTLHKVKIGKPINPSTIEINQTDEELSDFLRLSSMMLRYPDTAVKNEAESADNKREAIAAPIAPDLLEQEINSLPESCLCAVNESAHLKVYAAEAAQIPQMMQEIGIQREITFRAVGEGTGKSIDLDEYDPHYVHLIMWHTQERALAGAYRIGRTDVIMDGEKGFKGIYNSAFFKFSPKIQRILRRGIEMGRAFITPRFQKHPASLDTLWMGIGHYLSLHPEYRYMYGTVSVSSEYRPSSRALILAYLQQHCMNPELAKEIKAFNPPKALNLYSEDARLIKKGVKDLRLLCHLITHLEKDGKSIPVLLRQYLRLGGEMLSFGIDEDFGGTLDGLVLVDLCKTPERILRRFCGKDYVPRAND